MLLDVEQLAWDILGEGAEQAQVEQLAICLFHGNGAFRLRPNTRPCIAVLGSLLDVRGADIPHYPIVVKVRANPRPIPKKGLFATTVVAGQFRLYAVGAVEQPAGYRPSWAPAATGSTAVLSIGGVTAESGVAITSDVRDSNNEYYWYDLSPLEHFPIGCLVFRIDTNGQINVYQRVGPDTWCAFGGVWQEDASRIHLPATPLSGLQALRPELAALPRPLVFDPNA